MPILDKWVECPLDFIEECIGKNRCFVDLYFAVSYCRNCYCCPAAYKYTIWRQILGADPCGHPFHDSHGTISKRVRVRVMVRVRVTQGFCRVSFEYLGKSTFYLDMWSGLKFECCRFSVPMNEYVISKLISRHVYPDTPIEYWTTPISNCTNDCN